MRLFLTESSLSSTTMIVSLSWPYTGVYHIEFLLFLQIIHIDPTDQEEMKFWEEHNGNIAQMAKSSSTGEDDLVVALVCQDFTCSPPIKSPSALEELLSRKPTN